MSEDQSAGTLRAFKKAIIPTVWLSPGVIALFPYATRPVPLSEDAGIVDFTQAAFAHVFGMIPYLLEHPRLAAMALPTVLYMVWWATRKPPHW